MNYVRNAWYVGGWSDDLEQNKLAGIRILGEPIVLWRSEGQVVALADRCVHRLAPLSLGRCEAGNCGACITVFCMTRKDSACRFPGRTLFHLARASAVIPFCSDIVGSGFGWAIQHVPTPP